MLLIFVHDMCVPSVSYLRSLSPSLHLLPSLPSYPDKAYIRGQATITLVVTIQAVEGEEASDW